MKKNLLLAAAIVSLSGCESLQISNQNPPPSPMIAPAATAYEISTVRSFAAPSTLLTPLPSAFVLMRSSNDNNKLEQYNLLCEAYKASFSTSKDSFVLNSKTDLNLVSTRWLAKVDSPERESCKYLVDIYDYERAESLIQNINLGSAQGPFLVAFVPSSISSPDSATLVFDLSLVRADQLSQAFNDWSIALTKASLNSSHQSFNSQLINRSLSQPNVPRSPAIPYDNPVSDFSEIITTGVRIIDNLATQLFPIWGQAVTVVKNSLCRL